MSGGRILNSINKQYIHPMVLISDGYSELVAHACRKLGLFRAKKKSNL